MGEITPEEQFLLLSTIFCYLMLDFYVKSGITFSLRDKRLFEITRVETTRVDYIFVHSFMKIPLTILKLKKRQNLHTETVQEWIQLPI